MANAAVDKPLVRFDVEDGIGVITIDNPPVNALGPGVRDGIIEALQKGENDPAVKAMVMIDEIVPGEDLRAEAVAYARRIADRRPLPRVRDKSDRLAEAEAEPGMFEAMRKSIARKAGKQKAPYHCILCVEAAVSQPFDEGINTERRL